MADVLVQHLPAGHRVVRGGTAERHHFERHVPGGPALRCGTEAAARVYAEEVEREARGLVGGSGDR